MKIAIIGAGCSGLTKKYTLPSNWKALAYAEGEQIERRFLRQPRHAVEVYFHPYLKALRRAAGDRKIVN